MERSFEREVASLAMGAGDVFHGEGIVAVAKALLQSGVAYVGGYQGSPVSQLLDVLVEARPYLAKLGVHVEPCTNEASACALLAASVNYPLRGAVTWKSIVGSNVAADALSNIASPGVRGGALVIVGEDYGEGSSVVQERSHAFAMKSSLPLLDPRPDLSRITDLVGHAFALSEAARTPVLLELRVRACHLQGSFICRDNVAPAYGAGRGLLAPAAHDPSAMSHPPHTFLHEQAKVEQRLPEARRYIADHAINEVIGDGTGPIGIIVQGGLYNTLAGALAIGGLGGGCGGPQIPVLVLNATYPLVPAQLAAFCADRRAVLVLEEGHPEYIELELASILMRAGSACTVRGKAAMANTGEYTVERIARGFAAFAAEFASELDLARVHAWVDGIDTNRAKAHRLLGDEVPARPPGFCTGCPERPVFSALKLIERELGPRHVAADIGCHSFAMFEPFTIGNTITGYGLGLASAAAVAPVSAQRPLATVGDGGFWHNGLLSGVTSAMKNGSDSVLLIFKNGYTSATGTQEIVSTPSATRRDAAGGASATAADTTIERMLRAIGVRWLRRVGSYDVARLRRTFGDAFTTGAAGLKVVVADGECQLERQRRLRAMAARGVATGPRLRYGIDPDLCSGDRACVRLSGCPSLTVAPARDPLRTGLVTTIDASCVGCGLCGELAQTARLCPSFYRVEVVAAPTRWQRWRAALAARAQSQRREVEPEPVAGTEVVRVAEAEPVSGSKADSTIAQSRDPDAPLRILVAALGGQGGGVLTGWIVEAARAEGWRTHATSIPGVSQRTGATTYYVELAEAAPRAAHWVPALAPVPGQLDVLVGAELLETARMIERGMSAPETTTIVASTHRQYTTREKMNAGDGRFDATRIVAAARVLSRRAVLLDFEEIRARHASVISAALFGALAGAGVLPLSQATCRDVVGRGGAGAVASLAAFDEAASRVRGGVAQRAVVTGQAEPASGARDVHEPSEPPELTAAIAALPEPIAPVARRAAGALVDFQGVRYALRYLADLRRIAAAEAAQRDGNSAVPVSAEVALQLAAWMRYDDLIRVAALKTRASRFARIAREAGRGRNAIVRVDDCFSPGAEELAAILPRAAGAWLERRTGARRARDAARGRPAWRQRRHGFHWPTSSLAGMLGLRVVAALRPLRPLSLRWARERQAIDDWLDTVVLALAAESRGAPNAAVELARLPRLIRGYGETHATGRAVFERILASYRDACTGDDSAALAALRDEARAAWEGAGCAPGATGDAAAVPQPDLSTHGAREGARERCEVAK